jgi:hypothetical protein
MALELDASPHVELISRAHAKKLRLRDTFEVKAGLIKEFQK